MGKVIERGRRCKLEVTFDVSVLDEGRRGESDRDWIVDHWKAGEQEEGIMGER